MPVVAGYISKVTLTQLVTYIPIDYNYYFAYE
jgi:hypothetical protein